MKEVKPLMPKLKRREVADVLPGFVSHRAFFSSFTGGFTPVRVDAAEKRRLVSKIDQIHGQPENEVRSAVRDWMESAIVREVRKYENGETYVRSTVSRKGDFGNSQTPPAGDSCPSRK